MLDDDAILLAVVNLGVAPTLGRLARNLGVTTDELEEALLRPVTGGLLEFWEHPVSGIRVAPTPRLAERLGIQLDSRSRYWRAIDSRKARPERQRRQKKSVPLPDGDPYPDLRPPIDVDSMHPRPIMGCRAWPYPGQKRGPDAPDTPPRDDPRGQARLYFGRCQVCGNTLNRGVVCLACDRPKLTARLPEPVVRRTEDDGLKGGVGA